MTAPVWMASPPEVHSALLSSGPGPGSLLAAAGAWSSLSAEYASVADELGAVLAAVRAGAWEGPSAESYIAANVPYLAWLTQASADSAGAAARHETAAAAYTAALAAMPTLAELAANHVTHAVLVATNFFGINTIPIALNEADYARMWIQAATTMATYQAVSGTAVASTPHTEAAPQILKSADPTAQSGYSTFLADLLESLENSSPLVNHLINDFGIDNIFQFLENPVGYIESHLIHRLLTDPLSLLINPLYVFYDGDEIFFPLGYAFLPTTAGLAVVAPAGSVAGFAGLAGLAAAEAVPAAVAPALPPVAAAPAMLPAAGMAPTPAAPVAAPATAPAPTTAPATSAVAGSAPPTPPPAAGAAMAYPYLVGPPGIGFDSGMSTSAAASAKKKAPEPDSAAAAAAAAAREQARARRRRRAKLRGYSDGFMDMNVEVDPDWGVPPDEEPATSAQGAGLVGFAGAVRKQTVAEAAGLATLPGDEFGGGPRMPMVPGTWDSDQSDESGKALRHQHD